MKKHLPAVNKALANELKQKKPSESVIASCGMFRAACDRNAKDYEDFRAMNEKKEH